MNAKFFKGPVLAMALLAAAVLGGGNALAQNQPAQDDTKPAKAKSKSKKAAAKPGAARAGGKARFISGSEETHAQRIARLKRECKGGVDAGACAGYTR